jgi:N-methylhydantoinase A
VVVTYHVGIDIGGTFTDAYVTEGGRGWRGKAPTTPAALVEGVLASLEAAAGAAGERVEDLLARTQRFAIGTTAVTNTLAELSGAPTGLIVTRGFADLPRMARGHRLGVDGMSVRLPEIVPRARVEEVRERVDCGGEVLVALEEADVARAVRRLVEEEGVEALAVCLLWSFRNPRHERRIRDIARVLYPGLLVSCSTDVLPVIREYERLMTTVLNAYTWRSFSRFMDALEEELRCRGLSASVSVMQSNGGTCSAEEARAKPIFLAQSGPVAGVAAARALGERMRIANVITGDMGGTSFDVSVVVAGAPLERVRAELFGFWTGLVMVDVNSIGAGGGSIAWIDERGALRVGPRSAGASPGPAAYDRGGVEPTITDALVVLGLLDPGYFLGGEIPLSAGRAREAIETLAGPLELEPPAAAAGIYRMALEQMRGAIRTLLVEKGLDPREFVLMSYGGCAGLFAAAIAAELGLSGVVVPRLAAVFSAYGAATAEVRHDVSRTCFQPMPVAPESLAETLAALSRAAHDAVVAQGVAPERVAVRQEADLRFRKQQWEVTVAVPSGRVTGDTVRNLERDFLARYEMLYGRGTALLAAGIDLVNCRAVASGRLGTPGAEARLGAPREAPGGPDSRAMQKTPRRLAADIGAGHGAPSGRGAGLVTATVWDGETMPAGTRVDGPALIERRDTTVYVPGGMRAVTDDLDNVLIDVGGAGAGAGSGPGSGARRPS